jgi:type IV fimbrial biogenesis protein FimT
MDMNRQKGFTLLELMVTLFIASILFAVAIPSFKSMSARNRLVTYTNDLIASVNLARSEAVRRGMPVSICHSSDGEECSGSWSDGWITFIDPDNDGDVAKTEDIVRVHEALATKYTLAADDTFATHVTYGADGSANASGVFAVCHDGKLKGSRAIILTRLRPRVGTDTDNNGIPNVTDDGEDMDSCEEPSGS